MPQPSRFNDLKTYFLIEQYNRGVKIIDISREIGIDPPTVKHQLSKLEYQGLIKRRGKDKPGKTQVEKYIEKEEPRKYNDFFRITGDAIVMADAHLPYWHRGIFERAFAIGKKFLPKGKRQLILSGDFLNLDGFSKYKTGKGKYDVENELNEATRLLKTCLEVFDIIYWTCGNHEKRLSKYCDGKLPYPRIMKMLDEAEFIGRVKFSEYPYSTLNGNIRITHPENYGRVAGTVPAMLATKHRMNVISSHNHLVGMQASYCGQFWGIDVGMCGNPEGIEYYAMRDTTSPTWQVGFCMVLNGKPYPFLLNFTDFNFWLNKVKL